MVCQASTARTEIIQSEKELRSKGKRKDASTTRMQPVTKSSLNAPNPGAPESEKPVTTDVPLESGSAVSSTAEHVAQKGKSPSPTHSAGSNRKSASPTRNEKDVKGSKSVDREPASSTGNDISESSDNMGSSKDQNSSVGDKPAPPVKSGTMIATAKEGEAFLNNKRLGNSRSDTKQMKQATDTSAESLPKKAPVRKDHSMKATASEAEVITGAPIDVSEKRTLRSEKRKAEEPPKPTRDNTMKRTAKEGNAVLGDGAPTKRTRGGK
ncbi:uncharacterized protein LOC129585012 isoform X2 [Paramacrobiotus metropolitanus]|uniref:uncharacterized protein LOC129585012 isoform X2 n=1 Tax=Paramacrobiotus metropolitanus TaxID=2943436 RepID=UPI0024465658|nr:uncharacterized protein LOC129585012 isoform X2 [Paramacrobiotus metropolitanus]